MKDACKQAEDTNVQSLKEDITEKSQSTEVSIKVCLVLYLSAFFGRICLNRTTYLTHPVFTGNIQCFATI